VGEVRGRRGGGGEEGRRRRPLPRRHDRAQAAQASGSEPAPSSSPAAAPASGEEVGQKKHADVVAEGSDKKGDGAASLSENPTTASNSFSPWIS
jgi:hypothetical protein